MRWYNTSPYKKYFHKVWSNAIDATMKSEHPDQTSFGFYRRAICLVTDFYDHDLANAFQKATSEEQLWEDNQLNFIHLSPFSLDAFIAAIPIEPEWS